MGLFQFIKDMGEKIGGGKLDGPAIEEKIKEDLGSQVIKINAQLEDGVAILSGLCESKAAREKAVLIAGNIKGVSSISYYGLKVKEAIVQPETAPGEAAEEVKAGKQPEMAVTEEVEVVESQEVEGMESEEAEGIESEFYTIVSGDTLSKIAKQFYGDANKYPEIFDANKEVIKHPDKIYVGQTIRIPKINT